MGWWLMAKIPRLAGWVVTIIVAAATEIIRVIGNKVSKTEEKKDNNKGGS